MGVEGVHRGGVEGIGWVGGEVGGQALLVRVFTGVFRADHTCRCDRLHDRIGVLNRERDEDAPEPPRDRARERPAAPALEGIVRMLIDHDRRVDADRPKGELFIGGGGGLITGGVIKGGCN